MYEEELHGTAPAFYRRDSFLQGIKDCLPTILGYLSIGLAAGVVESTAGLSMLEIALLSVFVYAGSAQFIIAGMYAAGAPVTSIVITVLIVNMRHFLLSAALAPHFRHFATWQNVLTGFLLTDETFGVAANQVTRRERVTHRWFAGLNVAAYANWVVANLAGAFFGRWISDPEAFGLDFALPAMFIGLLVLQFQTRAKWVVPLCVAGSAIVLTVAAGTVFSSGIPVLLATMLAAAIGMVIEKWK